MAKLIEDILILKFSKIIKNDDHDPDPIITVETISALEQVAQELVGQNIVVEVEIK